MEAQIDRIFEKIHEAREEENKRNAKEKADAFEKANNMPSLGGMIHPINLSSPKELTEYISRILTLETNKISLKEWLEALYAKEADAILSEKEYTLFSNKEPLKKIRELKASLDKLNKTDPADFVRKETPKRKKVAYPAVPKEPEYETPNLFNKKRVEAENSRKRSAFEAAKMEYARALAEATHKQKVYDDEYEEAKKQAQEKYNTEYEAEKEYILNEIQQVQAEIEAWEEKAKLNASPEFLASSPAAVAKEIVASDIEKAEELLRKTYEACNKLYDLNIIFGKYRNPVALATFYEYLMAGRCVSLDGADGAYNLYEAEIRANMIIFQLSEVIENLEKIRENQYTIYSQLVSMQGTLETLNSTMNNAVDELRNIKADTAAIPENTADMSKAASVIAHNTAVTAYYTKKNAELTDALGYLIAMK